MKTGLSLIALALAVAAPAVVHAQESVEKAKPEKPADVEPQVRTTKLSGTFGGQRINYAATIGETIIKNKDGVPEVSVVTTAYIKEPRDPGRPVTFLFNGGPGSGTVWLMMGAFGPKRVAIPGDARDDGAPPYPIVDNPDALLDVTDIVFIDPPGTGFSHLIGKADPKDYYGVTQDAKLVAEVIRRWMNDNGRWNSPKYLGGESYGTTRSAAVANQLMNETYNDVALNGIILISTVLDFAAGSDTPGNELSYITNLPSMAATAMFHGKASGSSVEAFTEEARQWAIGPYASALLKGQKLQGEERAAIRRDLARFTGLSETYLESADLRVTPGRFYKELLRDRGLTVGRLDSRYTGKDYDNAGEQPDNDPSFMASTRATPRRSTAGAAMFWVSRLPSNINPSAASAGNGTGGSAGATPTPISTSRPISGRRCARIRGCACSSDRAIMISRRPFSPPNMRCRAPASRRTG